MMDAGTTDAGVPANPWTPFGSILITPTPSGLSVQAEFITWVPTTPPAETTIGACVKRTSNARATSTRMSAGTVTVHFAGLSYTLTRDGQGRYSGTVPLFPSAGDHVEVSGSGDQVPAFTISARMLPSTQITSPVCPLFSDCPAIVRGTPPTLQWNPIDDASTKASVIWADTLGSNLLTCEWPASVGSGTIEQVFWSSIPATERFVLLAEVVASHSVVVGDYTVVIGAAVDISFLVSE